MHYGGGDNGPQTADWGGNLLAVTQNWKKCGSQIIQVHLDYTIYIQSRVISYRWVKKQNKKTDTSYQTSLFVTKYFINEVQGVSKKSVMFRYPQIQVFIHHAFSPVCIGKIYQGAVSSS